MPSIAPDRIIAAVAAERATIARLFDALAALAPGHPGMMRASYGPGETAAHALVIDHARTLGLEISADAAANTYMTLPGRDRSLPRIFIGSHLDSVPHGGNFDGAAGVLAGLAALAVLRRLGIAPACDVTVMAVRAEESVWFQVSYIGSRAALGTLPPNALAVRRIDSGRTLADHIADCGGDPRALASGPAHLDPATIRAFVELHIEQAPSLVEAGRPIAIGTCIPGNFRYPAASVRGRYDHVGTPRRFRADAVTAAAELVRRMDEVWDDCEARGIPVAMTFGRFFTDPALHGLTTVPGELSFSLDVRAYDPAVLADLEQRFRTIVAEITAAGSVSIDLGGRTSAPVCLSDQILVDEFESIAATLASPCGRLLSPASHDAAAFGQAGVPVAMIFVRNRNGSHNPQEHMEIDDMQQGVAVLALWLAEHLS